MPIILSLAIKTTISGYIANDGNQALQREIERAPKMVKVRALKAFFHEQKSPLADESEVFVDIAEKYGLDYRLLPAISCMESSCGKKLIPGSYNPFGWGIYGNNAIYFKNWEEAIDTVGKGLKDNYVSKGYDTPEKIAPIYTPPNHVNWLKGVSYFINKIDTKEKELSYITAAL